MAEIVICAVAWPTACRSHRMDIVAGLAIVEAAGGCFAAYPPEGQSLTPAALVLAGGRGIYGGMCNLFVVATGRRTVP